MSKLFDYQSAEARLALADAVKAALAETYEKLHEAQLRELTRLTEHLTKAPRSTWRVAALTGSNTPDVAVEFPAQVAYIDNASTAAVQVRAPGDIAPSPPIPAGGQGVWLMPGATQLTVSGTGTGQVRIRFLNDAAARLLWQAPPSSVTAGGATQVALTGSLAPLSAPDGWVDIATFTAAQMPAAGGATYPSYEDVLHATARKRFFRIANSLNQTWTVSFWVCSTIGPNGSESAGAMAAQSIATNIANFYAGSESVPNLGEAGTAIQMSVTTGSTAPTTGQWTISVKEVF